MGVPPDDDRSERAGRRPRLSLRVRALLVFVLALVFTAAAAGVAALWTENAVLVALAAGLAGLLVGLPLLDAQLRPLRRSLDALFDGASAFEDGDFSMRMPAERAAELGEISRIYNRVGDVLREERLASRQKEWLLETVLRSTPMAIVLVNDLDRVSLSNREARRLLADNVALEGRTWASIVAAGPAPLREALERGRDSIFTVELEGRRESFHLAQRSFQMDMRSHTLVILSRMSAELRRQEVQVWKDVIRVISHELNNSLAPIASLAHSGKLISERPEQRHRLQEVFDTIAERARHLKDFLQGYARLARLPAPTYVHVEWKPFLAQLGQVVSFRLLGEPPVAVAHLDASQLEQVLINLIKNAHEAGSPHSEVTLALEPTPDGGLAITCCDRGSGLDDEALRRAFVPFHSTKAGGSGIGLALCQEILDSHAGRLTLTRRDGGGVRVLCWLPPARARAAEGVAAVEGGGQG